MKCGYTNCKLNGEVLKEEGVKVGSRWYHKECVKEKELKQEIENYWMSEINKGTVLQVLRKAIKDLVSIYDAEYILWVIKECRPRKINLSYPMGLKSLCGDNRFKDEWNRLKAVNEYRKVKDEINVQTSEDIVFKYIPSQKRVTDII